MVLSRFAIKHPAIIIIIMAALTLFGVMAFVNLNQEMIPPMGLPAAVVMAVYPGASPEDVNDEVTEILEDQFATMAGISSISSTSAESIGFITLSFTENTDIYTQVPLIREKINVIRSSLPEGLDSDPVIFTTEASAFIPIMSLNVTSGLDQAALSTYLEEELVPRINSLPGVSKTDLQGTREQAVFLTLDPEEMDSRGIAPLTVYEALSYNNRSVPSGEAMFRGREVSFKTAGEFETLEEIGSLIVGYQDGAFIYLRDIADIELRWQDPEFLVLTDGREGINIDVFKRDEGNTIELVDNIYTILDEMEAEYPGLFDFKTISDQSTMTKRSIDTVISSALTGIGLAILIILIFLGDIRSTIVIGLSIPLSLLTAMAAMFAAGQTLNILTLSGLTTAIGMIVDSSIVVLENTHKHTAGGLKHIEAAEKGASEVGGAVFASATTSICVFAPLIFLTGIVGMIMKDLAQTIVYALAASALIALVVVPFFYSHLPEPKIREKKKNRKGIFELLNSGYRSLLRGSLRSPFFIILASLLLMGGSFLLLFFMEVTFIPPSDSGEFNIRMRMPSTYSFEDTEAKTREISRRVHELVPEIENDSFTVGSSGVASQSQTRNSSYAVVRLLPTAERERSIQEIMTEVRETLAREIVDCDITIESGGLDALLGMATGGQGFQVDISGTDLDEVVAYAETVRDYMQTDADVFKADLNIRTNAEQLSANLDLAYMGSAGISSYEAGITSRVLFSGMTAGMFRGEGLDVPIYLESGLSDTPLTESALSGITITSSSGGSAPFSSISDLEFTPTVSAITRVDRKVTITVNGQMNSSDQGALSARITEYLSDNPPPFGVDWSIGGTGELMTDSIRSLGTILVIALFLVYSVMVIQFEKFIQPLIIMASIPFCFIGVLLGLMIAGSPFSMISMLGLISLGGIVVNNAIVLIDYVNLLRSRGMPLREAIVEGSSQRLKPILMTTLTTLAGVIPMAMASGNGAEIYAPLGQAIAGGLITSTLITLILIPVLYLLIEARGERRKTNEPKKNQELPHETA